MAADADLSNVANREADAEAHAEDEGAFDPVISRVGLIYWSGSRG